MKPSEQIVRGDLDGLSIVEEYRGESVQLENLLAYLDAEHERRAAWEKEQEQQVTDLQQRLEAVEGLVVP